MTTFIVKVKGCLNKNVLENAVCIFNQWSFRPSYPEHQLLRDVLPVCHVDPLYLPPSGPAAYTLPTPVPPSPYFGKRLSVDWDPHYPAPNVYDVPGLVGSGPAKSFGTKVEGGKGMVGHH